MDVLSLLPLLGGWQYRLPYFSQEDNDAAAPELSPGQNFDIIDDDGPGWLLGVGAAFNTLYGHLHLTIRQGSGQGEVTYHVSPYGLWLSRSDLPNNIAPWMLRYAKIPVAFRKTLTTAGTPERLHADRTMPDDIAVAVQALPGNTGNVYIASSLAAATSAANRKTLAPGQTVTLRVQNLNRIWLNTDVNGEGVEAIHEYVDTTPNTDSTFQIGFAPATPYFYREHLNAFVENPRRLPRGAGAGPNPDRLLVLSYQLLAVKVVDRQKFISDLHMVIGNATADQVAAMLSNGNRR